MRRIVIVLSVVFLVLPAIGSGQTSSRSDGREKVTTFVRVLYRGVPFDAASRYTIEDVAVLLPLLRDREDVLYWPNITMVLGIVGDDSTADELIRFLHGGDSHIEWSPVVFRGRMSALGGLGYLVHQNKDKGDRGAASVDVALDYLLSSVHPAAWKGRHMPWLDAREDVEQRRLQLSISAVLALALTGHDDAVKALNELRAGADTPERIKQVAKSVQPELAKIQEFGLAEYYGPTVACPAPDTTC